MSNDKHKAVSSDAARSRGAEQDPGDAGQNPHEVAAGEGSAQDPPSGGPEMVAEDYQGAVRTGELEQVPGFDPTRAMTEGMPAGVAAGLFDDYRSADELAPGFAHIETVCGSDERVRISPATAVPWRWICQLFITFPDGGRFVGTGWLIGPRCVMTAGHCVYSRANGGWARRIEVVPGMDGASRPFGSAVGTAFRSVTGWTTSADPNFDYGCIILPTPLGNTVGYFGFANLNDASLNGLLANNSGYPADKPSGTQWYNAGRVSSITSRKIYYMLDTYGGQSGSPVWRNLNGQRHAVGIHAYGGCPNSATRINTDVYNNMLAWRAL
jgi:V8-like Glu-specific endopeptidase